MMLLPLVLLLVAASHTAGQPWSEHITTDPAVVPLDTLVQEIDRWQGQLEETMPPTDVNLELDELTTSLQPIGEPPAPQCETLSGAEGQCQPTDQCLAWEPERRAFSVCQWHQEPGPEGQKVPVQLCCHNRSLEAAVDKFADPAPAGPKLLWSLYAFPGLMQTLEQQIELQQCGRRPPPPPPLTRWNAEPRLVYERRRGGQKPRIVAGVSVLPGQIPWMVSIYYRDQFVCGGSLISERHVLTAAHCFSASRDASLYYIRYGSTVLFDGEAAPVARVHVHEGYRPPVIYHDIALMELSYPVRLSGTVQPVCLATRHMYGDQLVGAMATVSGFGDQGFEVGKQSDFLQAVDVKVIENQYCDQSYRRLAESKRKFRFGIGRSLVCAGFEHGHKDACQGDSGGPLTVRAANNVHYQVGIVSFGFRCAQPQFPGIYTAVAHYRKWIMDLIMDRSAA